MRVHHLLWLILIKVTFAWFGRSRLLRLLIGIGVIPTIFASLVIWWPVFLSNLIEIASLVVLIFITSV